MTCNKGNRLEHILNILDIQQLDIDIDSQTTHLHGGSFDLQSVKMLALFLPGVIRRAEHDAEGSMKKEE